MNDDSLTKLDSAYENPDVSPGFLLWQVTNNWQVLQRQALKPFGLTHVQFVLLASLAWFTSDKPITQQRLAEHAKTDRMMTSQVIRTLERKGFVSRNVHPEDNRAFALAVTPEGLELVNLAVVAVEKVDQLFFSRLGEEGQLFTKSLRELSE